MWQKCTEKWRKLSTEGKALSIVVASLVVILLAFSFLPIMRVPYEVEETYQATETYYVQDSYTVEESYIVTEYYTDIEIYCDQEPPCQENIPIDYTVISGQGVNYFEFDGRPACRVGLVIENTDTESGEFTVEALITLRGDLTTTISASNYIAAGDTKTIIAYYHGEALKTLYSFSYSVTAPTKPNQSYREEEVAKEREVIEYGEVTKYEYTPVEVMVLKTRTVTDYKRVSLLDYLISY
ncbi:MAG: hypothetical protein E3J92_03815 [Dehalococcoidia bacterium]|nr:MAG: hypothetical protein E3J92_03815 [Dehalococcoidia bacterium]